MQLQEAKKHRPVGKGHYIAPRCVCRRQQEDERRCREAEKRRQHQSGVEQKEPPALVKKIGKMTYIVRVHFSPTSKETFTDKVNRLLRQEVRQMMENDGERIRLLFLKS